MSFSSSPYLSFSDLHRLFCKHKRGLKKTFLFSCVLSCLYLLCKPTLYKAEATFRQGHQSVENTADLKQLLQIVSLSQESSSISILLSRTLLSKTVQDLGWQVQKCENPLAHLAKNLASNLKAEAFFPLAQSPIFTFRSVVYKEDGPLFFSCRFVDASSFEVFQNGKKIQNGKIGELFQGKNFSFVLQDTPPLQLDTLYHFEILPLFPLVQKMKSYLTIKPLKTDSHILHLSFSHPKAQEAALFLNTLLTSYQSFLQEENTEIGKAQIGYLEHRQEELQKKLHHILYEQENFLKGNLEKHGFLALEKEIDVLSIPKQSYKQKLIDIDLELLRLKKEGSPALSSAEEPLYEPGKEKERYLQCLADIEHIEKELQENLFLQEKVEDEATTLSSLSSLSKDPAIQELFQKAISLEFQKQDEITHSHKEHTRVQDALHTQKKFLLHYLQNSIEIKKRQWEIYKKKAASLQAQVCYLLEKEKDLLSKKLEQLVEQMKDLPEKWRLDNELKLKSTLTLGIMEGLAQITESKILGNHLFHISCKPLDLSYPPLKPLYPFVLLFSLLAAFFITALVYLYRCIEALFVGFPASLETLYKSGLSSLGRLSYSLPPLLSDVSFSDLETLRKASLLLEEKKTQGTPLISSFLLGTGEDFLPQLASLLFQKGYKIAIFDCNLSSLSSREEIPGLSDILHSPLPSLPFRSFPTYDFLPKGSSIAWSTEQLASLSSLFPSLPSHYDFIFLKSRAKLNSTESLLVAKLSSVAVISYETESSSLLETYHNTIRQKETLYATFVEVPIRSLS